MVTVLVCVSSQTMFWSTDISYCCRVEVEDKLEILA